MYKVSVVTPFHNVDMGMFQKCADSMRGQTLGFENIEWIIVVHNSKPHYLPLLIDMFKDDKNVIIKELHDDLHSPASPRNHGMQFLDTRRIADMFDYITTHRDELIAELRDINTQRADEVKNAFHSEQPLAKALWPKLERIVAFGAGEYYDATAHMKQFTGQIPHNNGYYYTEETIYGRAIADDSDIFETLPSKSFHEYQTLNDNNTATLLSTDTKPGEPYQLVVTNSAGLYRYVTDHIVCIQEKQIDKILFTIY